MPKLFNVRELKEKYLQGVNIISDLTSRLGAQANTSEIISVSYDLQAGSYVGKFLTTPDDAPAKVYRQEVASLLTAFDGETVMEAGIGEATTLFFTSKTLGASRRYFGFDISWSRIAVAREFLKRSEIAGVSLAVGDLFSIPLPDSSIDLVYTSHSIEPNGGREAEAIAELYRVARRWLVLFEPSSELGGPGTQKRISQNGYCRDLANHARSLGLDVREHRILDHPARPDNQTAMLVIHKPEGDSPVIEGWACPECKCPFDRLKGHFFCNECLSVYPQIDDIPCLLEKNGILATRFKDCAVI